MKRSEREAERRRRRLAARRRAALRRRDEETTKGTAKNRRNRRLSLSGLPREMPEIKKYKEKSLDAIAETGQGKTKVKEPGIDEHGRHKKLSMREARAVVSSEIAVRLFPEESEGYVTRRATEMFNKAPSNVLATIADALTAGEDDSESNHVPSPDAADKVVEEVEEALSASTDESSDRTAAVSPQTRAHLASAIMEKAFDKVHEDDLVDVTADIALELSDDTMVALAGLVDSEEESVEAATEEEIPEDEAEVEAVDEEDEEDDVEAACSECGDKKRKESEEDEEEEFPVEELPIEEPAADEESATPATPEFTVVIETDEGGMDEIPEEEMPADLPVETPAEELPAEDLDEDEAEASVIEGEGEFPEEEFLEEEVEATEEVDDEEDMDEEIVSDFQFESHLSEEDRDQIEEILASPDVPVLFSTIEQPTGEEEVLAQAEELAKKSAKRKKASLAGMPKKAMTGKTHKAVEAVSDFDLWGVEGPSGDE